MCVCVLRVRARKRNVCVWECMPIARQHVATDARKFEPVPLAKLGCIFAFRMKQTHNPALMRKKKNTGQIAERPFASRRELVETRNRGKAEVHETGKRRVRRECQAICAS